MIQIIRNKIALCCLLLLILTGQLFGLQQSKSDPTPKHFILVHGAWQGAWCWAEVSNILEKEGHTVTVLDLPAHGIDMNAPVTVTLTRTGYSRWS